FLAMFGIGFRELAPAPGANRFGQFPFEITEEGKRLTRPPFVSHEHQRGTGLEQQHRKRRLERCGIGQYTQALAEGTIADLIVVLQEIDESAAGQLDARLTAQAALAMLRGFTLI